MTPTERAIKIRNRAKKLGPSAREVYGNDVDIILDEDALLQACVEQIEEVLDDISPVLIAARKLCNRVPEYPHHLAPYELREALADLDNVVDLKDAG